MKAKSVLAQEMWGKLKQQDKDYWFVARRLRDRTFCIERYPKPSYTRTSAQDEQRNKFKSAVNAWNALSPSEKEQWNKDAEPFGLTGYQYFIQQYLLAPPAPSEIWYRVTINNSGGSALSDYQILINIQNDEQFFNDCQDKREAIRLFDTDKETSLSYWIEEWDTANHNAKIWVKVPSIPGSGTKTIYISVDPNRTTDNSDGEATFNFFDHFDTDTSSEYTIDKGSFEWQPTESRIRAYAVSQNLLHHNTFEMETGQMIMTKLMTTNADKDALGPTLAFQDSSNFYHARIHYSDAVQFYKWVGGSASQLTEASQTFDSNTWYKIDVAWLSASHIKVFVDGIEKIDISSGLESWASGKIGIRKYDNVGSDAYFDYIIVRKYTEPEPTVSYEKETA